VSDTVGTSSATVMPCPIATVWQIVPSLSVT
jgi:hypothetical protein